VTPIKVSEGDAHQRSRSDPSKVRGQDHYTGFPPLSLPVVLPPLFVCSGVVDTGAFVLSSITTSSLGWKRKRPGGFHSYFIFKQWFKLRKYDLV